MRTSRNNVLLLPDKSYFESLSRKNSFFRISTRTMLEINEHQGWNRATIHDKYSTS